MLYQNKVRLSPNTEGHCITGSSLIQSNDCWDLSVHAHSQWETMFHCNVVSHRLGACTQNGPVDWSPILRQAYIKIRGVDVSVYNRYQLKRFGEYFLKIRGRFTLRNLGTHSMLITAALVSRHITCPLCEGNTGRRWIPLTGANFVEFDVLLLADKAVELTVELSVIWDAITLTWGHCKKTITNIPSGWLGWLWC